MAATVSSLETQLAEAEGTLQLVQIPGAGRGIVAAHGLPHGTVIHTEAPLLCAPPPAAPGSACYNCLCPLQLPPQLAAGVSAAAGTDGGARFCSVACERQAVAEFWDAEQLCDLSELRTACAETNEKFPVLAARLACMMVQEQWQQSRGSIVQQEEPTPAASLQRQEQRSSTNNTSRGRSSRGSSVGAGHDATQNTVWGAASRGDALSDLRHLCYAAIGPKPPQPWADTHRLLIRSLRPLAAASPGLRGWMDEVLTLDWYCRLLSRLHLNVFRVDTVPPLDLSDPSALLRAASASLGTDHLPPRASLGANALSSHPTGSAIYALASMFNHSCEPNLDPSFPHNDATLALTAARGIAKGEQLTISYIDASMGAEARRAMLQFAYGFECACPRCMEGT